MTATVAIPGATWGFLGNRLQVSRLLRYVETGQIPSAILMTGASGTGRVTLARSMAKALVCVERPAGDFCGECIACMQVESGSHPDFDLWSVERQDTELTRSAGGQLRIETIRAIASSTVTRPQIGERRFIVIDDTETLENAAQQAMLKMLEDVPSFLTIVLIATRTSALIDTVLSRCVEIPLQLVPTTAIQTALSGPEADEIACLAGGRPGWAFAASRDTALLESERAALSSLEAWIAMSRRDRLIEAYRRGDRLTNRDRQAIARDRRLALADLDRLERLWRDVVMTSANVPDAAFDGKRSKTFVSRLDLNARAALNALRATVTCRDDLLGNIRPRLAIQTMVNQWPTP